MVWVALSLGVLWLVASFLLGLALGPVLKRRSSALAEPATPTLTHAGG